MSFIVGILTIFLIINCLLLILLVLIQLPKKDAGAGMAFGAGAADALFGAGSGNALTKITKFATVIFLLLALGLGSLYDKFDAQRRGGDGTDFIKDVQQKQQQTQMQSPAPKHHAPATPVPPGGLLSTVPTNATK